VAVAQQPDDEQLNSAVNPSRQPAEGGREEIDDDLARLAERRRRERGGEEGPEGPSTGGGGSS